MAKRTVSSTQSGSNVAAPPTAAASADNFTHASILEDNVIRLSEEQVRLSSEEVHAHHSSASTPPQDTPAVASDAQAAEWSFVCPFCCASRLTKPVELHEPAPCAAGDGPAHHCLACQACAERWFAAMRVLEEPSRTWSSSTAGNSASAQEVSLTCPLCDSVVPESSTHHLTPLANGATPRTGGISSILQHPETVRNCYTGLVAPDNRLTAFPAGSSAGNGVSANATSAGQPTTLYCGVCEDQRATCVCVQCDFGLCDDCRRATHSKGKFKQHEVVGLDQARRRDQLKCAEHAGMALDLYCETCATCVCVTCCFGGAHRGHEVFPLADVAQRTGDVLSAKAQELSETRGRADAARGELAALWPVYEAKVSAVEADIEGCFASLRRILQEREDALRGELRRASAEVKRRSTELHAAAGAIADLLDSATAGLSNFPGNVSPATLMRVAAHVQEQQAWTLRAATRLTEEATATVDGWKYQLAEEGVNGCRMACFDMLNAQTPNEKGILQYQQVLADLGRLDVSAELQPPMVRSSAVETENVHERGSENEEDDEERQRNDPFFQSAGVEQSVVGPILEVLPELPTPPQKQQREQRNERSTSPASARLRAENVARAASTKGSAVQVQLSNASAEVDVPQLRPSHVAANDDIQAPQQGRITELQLTSGTAGPFSRVAALRSVTSARASLPRSLVIGSGRAEGGDESGEEAQLSSFAVSRGTSSTSQVRAALDELERRDHHGSSSARLGSTSGHGSAPPLRRRGNEETTTINLARDTMPFRVSMPQKRVLSLDRTEEAQNSAASSSSSWRALKVYRAGMMQDAVSGDGAVRNSSLPPSHSTWQTSASTRLSFFSEFEVNKPHKSSTVSPMKGLGGAASTDEHRATLKRKTTNLQLEL